MLDSARPAAPVVQAITVRVLDPWSGRARRVAGTGTGGGSRAGAGVLATSAAAAKGGISTVRASDSLPITIVAVNGSYYVQLEELAAEQAGKLKVVKLNVDDSPDIARRYKVLSIPTLMVFADGDERKRIVGARGKQQLESEVADFIGG